jgi:hypothetical protein
VEPRYGFTFWVASKSCLYTYFEDGWDKTIKSAKIQDLKNVALTELDVNDILAYNGSDFVNSKDINVNSITIKEDAAAKTQLKIDDDGNLSVSVSADGQEWNESFTVENATGNIFFSKDIKVKEEWLDNLLEGNISQNDLDLKADTKSSNLIQGFKWIQNIQVGNGDVEVIISIDNTKTYKIFIEDLRSSSNSNNPYLQLRFGDETSFVTTGYNHNNERYFTGGYDWGHINYNNDSSIKLSYVDGYVYNTRALSGEINIPASKGTTFPLIGGTTNSCRLSDNYLITSKCAGVLNNSSYNYSRIRLFLSANSFYSGIIRVYQIL